MSLIDNSSSRKLSLTKLHDQERRVGENRDSHRRNKRAVTHELVHKRNLFGIHDKEVLALMSDARDQSNGILQRFFRYHGRKIHLSLKTTMNTTVFGGVSFFTLWAFLVNFVYENYSIQPADWCSAVSGGIAVLLVFMLTFHNKECESRWWEARCLWGTQIYASLNLTQMAAAWIPDNNVADRCVRHIIVFSLLTKQMLRNQDIVNEELDLMLGPKELEYLKTFDAWKPYRCLDVMRACMTRGLAGKGGSLDHLTMIQFQAMNEEVSNLAKCIGGCIRVKGTPFPKQQEGMMVTFTWVYFFAFPWTAVVTCGAFTPVVTTFVAWLFLGLEWAGYQIQMPFFDLNLDLFCSVVQHQCTELYLSIRARKSGDEDWDFSESDDDNDEFTMVADARMSQTSFADRNTSKDPWCMIADNNDTAAI